MIRRLVVGALCICLLAAGEAAAGKGECRISPDDVLCYPVFWYTMPTGLAEGDYFRAIGVLRIPSASIDPDTLDVQLFADPLESPDVRGQYRVTSADGSDECGAIIAERCIPPKGWKEYFFHYACWIDSVVRIERIDSSGLVFISIQRLVAVAPIREPVTPTSDSTETAPVREAETDGPSDGDLENPVRSVGPEGGFTNAGPGNREGLELATGVESRS